MYNNTKVNAILEIRGFFVVYTITSKFIRSFEDLIKVSPNELGLIGRAFNAIGKINEIGPLGLYILKIISIVNFTKNQRGRGIIYLDRSTDFLTKNDNSVNVEISVISHDNNLPKILEVGN